MGKYTWAYIPRDVSLLSELLELLVPVLESFQEEAAPLGLEVNWQKTMAQALGPAEDVSLSPGVWAERSVCGRVYLSWGSDPLFLQ